MTVRQSRQALSCSLRPRAVAFALLGLAVTGAAANTQAQTLLSQGRPAFASSTETAMFPASAAVDG
ncbi:MAG TPA: hypothetical protein VF310_09140, partial [Vicinamibacteria bacterium]